MMREVSSIEQAIVERGAELKRLVDAECSQLLDQLRSFKEERLKEIETRNNEIQAQVAKVESFKLYIEELTDKGSACAITQSARGLMDRMKEQRQKSQEENSASAARFTAYHFHAQTFRMMRKGSAK